jgi:carbonic anhydrase
MKSAIVAFGAVLLFACGGGGAAPAADATHEHAAASGPAHWAYTGASGPEHWADLEPGFAACKSGSRQTPIDLPSGAAPGGASEGRPEIHYGPIPLVVTNNGHSIQVDSRGPASVVYEGSSYDLVQFHFHSPSEHTFGGEHYAAELHLVHKNAQGKHLVVGVLFKKGVENAALAPLWAVMPMTTGPTREASDRIEVAPLIPKTGRILRYDGSLTTPPCTEGLTWLVFAPEATLEISDAQIAKFQSATHGATSRPIQATNGRAITEIR